MISSARGDVPAFTRKDLPVEAFSLVKDAVGLLVALSNATGHRRAIRAMHLRDPHGAVAACIRPAHIHCNARAVVATPVVVMPAMVTITPTILRGRRRRYRKQRQRCQSDKSYLHCVFSSSDEVQRFLCFGVPKQQQ